MANLNKIFHSKKEKEKGKHEPISVSEELNDITVKANSLILRADVYKQQAQVGISKCIANASDLNNSRNYIKKQINETVEEMVKLVRQTGKAIEAKVDDICKKKDEKSNSQIDELKSTISDVEKKQESIAKFLKSGEATAIKRCQQAIAELQEKIAVPLETEPRDDGKIYFSSKKDKMLSYLEKLEIGSVSEKPNENTFEILCENPITVTCYQPFYIEIAQRYKCEIDIEEMTVSTGEMTPSSTEDTSPTTKIVSSKGKYFVEVSSSRDLSLDVKFCNISIKGSPIKIIVEPVGVVKCIQNVGHSTWHNNGIADLVMFQNGWFYVVCKNDIFNFDNSGAFIGTIKLPSKSSITRIYKMKNNHLTILLSDENNCKIAFCKNDGQVIKSMSIDESFFNLWHKSKSLCCGIAVNEHLNLVYLAGTENHCVEVYNMESNSRENTIGCYGSPEGYMNKPSDITLTKKGNLIVADTANHRVQLFGSGGQFIKVLIGGGAKDGMVRSPTRVLVDNDDNIIVASENKIQLFNNCAKFLKVIHENNTYKSYFTFSIVSHYPRRLALAERYSRTINVINY